MAATWWKSPSREALMPSSRLWAITPTTRGSKNMVAGRWGILPSMTTTRWKSPSREALIIIKALGNHLHHAGVQLHGSRALGNLAINDANSVEIAKQGGIDAIIKALGNHPDHAGVQNSGCGALASLAINGGNMVEIA